MIKIIISVSIICFLLIFGSVLWYYWYLFPPSFIDVVRDVRDSIFDLAPQDPDAPAKYSIVDTDFRIEVYADGLNQPTTMDFLPTTTNFALVDDIIVLEKNSGKVLLIEYDPRGGGGRVTDTLVDFNVNSYWESGLLGVTVNDNDVYFYLTEAEEDGGERTGNNIYRFYWDGENLINKELINSLEMYSPGHNAGVMATGLDGQVYAMNGDQGAGQDNNIIRELKGPVTLLQNNNEGEFDDTGVIIRVGLDKDVITPKYAENPLDHYYAIGIRNGFGLAVDPVTGNLWDTENGEIFFDEINLVSENFNSGWAVTMGPGFETNGAEGDLADLDGQIEDLLNFNKYTYAEPKFSWEKTVTPTGLTFTNSEPFGKYTNELFVGTCIGEIHKFKLNDNRDNFIFDSTHLQDLAANIITNESGENIVEPLDEIEFGNGFGCITDIKFGPDGNLYIVSLSDNIIYRIVPK